MASSEPGASAASTARRAYHLNPSDNVAVALADLEPGEVLDLPPGRIVVTAPVPFGHKVAVVSVALGEEVRKYGEVIGLASAPIRPGDHVHVHNVESQRGRGDLHRAASAAT
jgi:altronate dehydratase small subunit